MKEHLHMSQLKNSNNIIYIGYCKAQYLLSTSTAYGSNAGGFGWNYDAYAVNGLTICTGYRNLPGRPAVKVAEYEAAAKAVYNDSSLTFDQVRIQINRLLYDFCIENGGLNNEKEDN